MSLAIHDLTCCESPPQNIHFFTDNFVLQDKYVRVFMDMYVF